MANHTVWLAVTLVVMLVILLVKMNNLNGELNELGDRNKRLDLQQDTCRRNVKSLLASGEEKRKAAQRRVEEVGRISETRQKELSEIKEELQNKVIAYDSLQKILEETKKAVNKEKRELSKAVEETQRYHNLYLAENMKLTSVSKAYEKLRLHMKMGGRQDENGGESIIKREVTGGTAGAEPSNAALTQKHDAGPRQLDSLAAGTTTKQEQDHNQTKELQEQQQQQKQDRQQEQQQQEEGNKEKGNEREKGREQQNEVHASEEEAEEEVNEKAME